jgi:hypothetical protein
MKRMTGLLFMTLGLLIFVVGLVIYTKSGKQTERVKTSKELDEIIEIAIVDGVLTKNERNVIKRLSAEKNLDYDSIIKETEIQISNQKTDAAETELIDFNKKNGYDFEKFIVQKFDKKYFKIKEWAGDKYVNGVYAKTTPQPDILFEFKVKDQTTEFSVECKWRSNYFKKGIEFAGSEQFKRYQDFEKKRNTPVFIAIGVGGTGKNPEQLFIVPLKSIDSNFISIETLKVFEKKRDSEFFFDLKTNELN